MIVLTRKLREGFVVGDDVRIVVSDINGNQVRLGIEAPREINVLRKELHERIRKPDSAAHEKTPESSGLDQRYRPKRRCQEPEPGGNDR